MKKGETGNGGKGKSLTGDGWHMQQVCHPSSGDLEKGKGEKTTNFNQGRVAHECHPSLGDP